MSARTTRTSAMVRSLGIGISTVSERCVLVGRGWPERGGRGCVPRSTVPRSTVPRSTVGESFGIEEGEVHRGLAVHDPGGDVAAGGRGVLEAVAAEADGEEEAL